MSTTYSYLLLFFSFQTNAYAPNLFPIGLLSYLSIQSSTEAVASSEGNQEQQEQLGESAASSESLFWLQSCGASENSQERQRADKCSYKFLPSLTWRKNSTKISSIVKQYSSMVSQVQEYKVYIWTWKGCLTILNNQELYCF